MNLSKRLQSVADLVSPCDTFADIGCDHAYLSISLVQNNIAKRAIASDINAGPLKIAEEHIREAGLENCITTIQTDGITGIFADVIAIAGMGGNLMLKILQDSPRELKHARELVLQPQSELALFRKGLLDLGLQIVSEDFVIEDEKYYPMMKAVKGKMELDETQANYGPILLRDKNEGLKCFLLKQNEILTGLIRDLSKRESTRSRERLLEVKEELGLNENALKLMKEEIK